MGHTQLKICFVNIVTPFNSQQLFNGWGISLGSWYDSWSRAYGPLHVPARLSHIHRPKRATPNDANIRQPFTIPQRILKSLSTPKSILFFSFRLGWFLGLQVGFGFYLSTRENMIPPRSKWLPRASARSTSPKASVMVHFMRPKISILTPLDRVRWPSWSSRRSMDEAILCVLPYHVQVLYRTLETACIFTTGLDPFNVQIYSILWVAGCITKPMGRPCS